MPDTAPTPDPPLELAGIDAMAAEIQAGGVGPVTESFNASLIEAYRANGGQLPGDLAIGRFLLLTTTGARSGKRRTVPLGYVRTEGRTFILASLGGRPENPAWYHNLVANPDVVVELGAERFPARARVAAEPERTRLFDERIAVMPRFGDYVELTDRTIPVVVVERS
jgi:deazaflavin-dependent oxidoreductase (nitroreductase family)